VTDQGSGRRKSLWDQEPFATFRAEPKRFAIGLPIVFFGGALAGALLLRQSLQVALGVQFGLQTLGFLWLYLPALRCRKNPED